MPPADSSGSQASRGRKLEVEVSQAGRILNRIKLRRSPATIGRGTEADIQLESGHISRLHARVYFDDEGLTVVDAGSTNGFTVRGRRLKEAKVATGEAVDVAGFILVFRWSEMPTSDVPAVAPPPDDWGSQVAASPAKTPVVDDWASRVAMRPTERLAADGWEEFEESDAAPEPDTAIRRIEEVEAERPAKPALDPAIPAGSVLNRMVHQAAPPSPPAPVRILMTTTSSRTRRRPSTPGRCCYRSTRKPTPSRGRTRMAASPSRLSAP
jgi:hypothetical protein